VVKKKNPSPGILDFVVDVEKGCFSPLTTIVNRAIIGAMLSSTAGKSSVLEDLAKALTTIIDTMAKAGAFGAGPALGAHAINSLNLEKAKVVEKTPEGAWKTIEAARDAYNTGSLQLLGLTTVAGLIPFGSVGDAVDEVWRVPYVQTALEICTEAYLSEFRTGIVPLLKRYWLKQYKPFIPPIEDLRLMAVREAFPVEPGEPQYKEMEKWAIEQGMDPYWTQRYLFMGFIRMDLRQAYENLWRGFWKEEEFKSFLRIADIHPDDRDPVYKVAFRPPGVREMGYGYDTGEYNVEDIVKYRRWGGLSPEDAAKAGRAMVAYRTEAEREALRREALYDFTAGLDDETQLRANLTAIGGRPEIIDLWVARAKYRAMRDLTLDLVKVVTTDFVKGWTTENEFRNELIKLNVAAERREVIIRDAKSKLLAYKKTEDAEKHKLLTKADVSKARELGLIGDEEYVRRLTLANYAEDDAKLLLAIELTPRPITPEEIERRKATVTSRLNKAKVRWEDRLKRIQNQIELTALQRDDLAVIRDESLDVIDVQIASVDATIPVVAPEKVPALADKRAVLVARREASEAQFAARIRKLTEQHTDLTEQKALMERQRDEELGEYEEELKLIGGVAG